MTEETWETTASVECTRAEDLIAELSPLHARWSKKPSSWVFRGLGDSKHELWPTAQRHSSWHPFMVNTNVWGSVIKRFENTPVNDVNEERTVLAKFFLAMDAAGLPIPGDSVDFRGHASQEFMHVEPWPNALVWPFMALARHHGVPTRLLDWSTQSRVAAYFAAKDACQNSSFKGTLDVWALKLGFVRRWCEQNPIEGLNLRVVVAPRASNPNLHAQAGLFTVLIGDRVQPLNRYIENFFRIGPSRGAWGLDDAPPLMYRFSLLQKEAGKLLRLLSYESVSGATMFPGVAGAVESLKEHVLWDERPEREEG